MNHHAPLRSHPLRVFLLALLLATLGSSAFAQQGGRVTVAAYNLENFFDVYDDPYTDDEDTAVKPRPEIEALARAIRALDADVIAVSEVENGQVLRAMARTFLSDMGYEYVTVGATNSGRGINLGLISRLPIERVASYRFRELTLPGHEQTWQFARDLMHVTLDLPGGERPLELFIAHFKSKRDSAGDPDSADWRLAEATAARALIDDLLADDPQALVALAGDLNDTPDSPTLARLLQGDVLHDAHAALPAEQRITYLRPLYRSMIDYVLVSPALAATIVPGSPRVLDDAALLEGSDHAPIAVTFDLGR